VEYLRQIKIHDGQSQGPVKQTLADRDGYLINAMSVPAGSPESPRHVHECDQVYFVLNGQLDLELDGEEKTLESGAIAYIPAGTPHRDLYRHSGSVEYLDILVAPPARGLPLMTEVPDEAPADGGRGFVRMASDVDTFSPVPGFRMGELVGREIGCTGLSLRYTEVAAGSPGMAWHFHDFDQLYFMLGGTLHSEVAHRQYDLQRRDLVILPAGVVHRNWNGGDTDEAHLTLLFPTPEPGVPADYFVRFDLTGEYLALSKEGEVIHKFDGQGAQDVPRI